MKFSPFSCPIFLGHPEARGRCSQGERVHSGRDPMIQVTNLRGCFKRFVGRNRKAEAAKLPGAGIGASRAQEVGNYRYSPPLRYGENSGDSIHAQRRAYIVPLPKIFLTHLFSKVRLKRKDFRKVERLPWAQEAPGSNPGAPTKFFRYLAERSISLSGLCSPRLDPVELMVLADHTEVGQTT